MGRLSGIHGIVDGEHTVGEWRITHTADTVPYSASNTKQGTARLDGNLDWSGSYQAFGHTPAVMPGDSFTFKGSMSVDRLTGATGTAICDQVEIRWDIEAGSIIDHTTTFSADGTLTVGTITDPGLDTVVPNPPSSIGTKVELAIKAGSPSFVELPDVRTITMTITRANVSFISSSTAGQTQRDIGPVDISLAISIYTDDAGASAVPDPNDSMEAKLYVDATTHWHLKWAKFSELSDYTVNRATGELVSATCNAAMSGYEDISGTGTEGFVKKPSGATWWPV